MDKPTPTTVLPAASEMEKRLNQVDNARSLQQSFYPLLTAQTGDTPEACPRLAASEVLQMLQYAILEFGLSRGTKAEAQGVNARIKLYLRAIIDDEPTYQQALRLADEL